MFDDTPPGQHPTRISPRAIPVGRWSSFVMKNAKNGMIKYWAIAPMQISNGLCARILKSSVVRVSPMLNMMTPIMIDWLVNLFATGSVNNWKFTYLCYLLMILTAFLLFVVLFKKTKSPFSEKTEKGRKNPRYHPNSVIKLQLLTYYHTLSL